MKKVNEIKWKCNNILETFSEIAFMATQTYNQTSLLKMPKEEI